MTAPRTLLGDSEVLHALKSGGMGDVLLARRRGKGGFEQLCAVKTIRGELASAPLARTMFLDEARLLARLTHPAIAQILDFGEQDGTLYMVIEYVPGEHFRRFGQRRPPPAIVCAAMAAACRGLHAAHELRDLNDGHLLGVVHRDISPDNLMLGFDARVKVLDFGIALVKGRQAPVTEFGVLKGKPPYMSPEQVKNQALDRRADVWSACTMLHELLAGQVLFQGDSIYAIARAVEHQVILPPSHFCGPLPRDLDDVVMAGLERDLDKRLASAAALAEVLERIASANATESLEAWTDRELAEEREQHRVWLARLLAASGPMNVPGRPTGMTTAVGDLTPPTRETLPSSPTTIDGTQREPAPPPPPLDGADDDVAPPARRGRIALVLAALLALAAVAMFAILRPCGGTTAPVSVPPPADAAVIPWPAPVDAALADAAAPDAAVSDARELPVDAGPRRRPDAAPRPIDAAPPPRPVDAAAAAPPPIDAPTGHGFLTFTPNPYAKVSVDGRDLGASPIYRRKFPAGRHDVVFTHPVTGDVVLRRTVELQPDQTVVIP